MTCLIFLICLILAPAALVASILFIAVLTVFALNVYAFWIADEGKENEKR